MLCRFSNRNFLNFNFRYLFMVVLVFCIKYIPFSFLRSVRNKRLTYISHHIQCYLLIYSITSHVELLLIKREIQKRKPPRTSIKTIMEIKYLVNKALFSKLEICKLNSISEIVTPSTFSPLYDSAHKIAVFCCQLFY